LAAKNKKIWGDTALSVYYTEKSGDIHTHKKKALLVDESRLAGSHWSDRFSVLRPTRPPAPDHGEARRFGSEKTLL
jgi:hypothetical protein